MTGSDFGSTGAGSPAQTNPFVGPHPIEKGQRIFGRDREIEELYYLLSAQRIVLLHSPSGAGKSSLIHAGLIPRLAGHFDVWGPARVNEAPPAATSVAVNRYVRSVNLQFESQIPLSRQRLSGAVGGATLGEYVANRPRRRSAPDNVVLIFDQFEEVLTADPLAIEAKREFFRQLGELLRDPKVWALFAIREDYLAQFDPYAEMLPTHLKNRFRLDLLTREATHEAIVQTVESGGRTATEFAVDKIVRDLATMQVQRIDGTFESQIGPYVEPLHMQVACRELWARMPEHDRVIDLEDVVSFGDVTSSLANYYTREVARLAGGSEPIERAIREWAGEKLITKAGTRSQVLKDAGTSAGLANEMIARLVDTHLIRSEHRSGAVWFELAHDRLIEPVRKNNNAWFEAHLSKLQKVAGIWESQGRPEGLLLLGDDLAEARKWGAGNAAILTPAERKFLEASDARHKAILHEKRRVRQLRWLLAGAATLAVVAVVAAVGAYFAQQRAVDAGLLALEETRKANVALARTWIQAGNDAIYRKEYNEALAHFSQALRADPNSLAAQSWVSDLLLRQNSWVAGPGISPGKDEEIVASLVDAERVFISKNAKKALQAYDSVSGSPVGPLLSFRSAVQFGGFSRDGKRAAVFYLDDKTAQVWDLYLGKPLSSPIGPLKISGQGPVVGLSPDGQRVVTASDTTQLWDAATGNLLYTLLNGYSNFAFSADSMRLATAAVEDVQVWNVSTGKAVGPTIKAQGLNVFLNANGSRVGTASSRSLNVWEVATGAAIGVANGESGQGCEQIMGGIEGAFHVAGLNADGTRAAFLHYLFAPVCLLDAGTSTLINRSAQGDPVSVEFSGDGKLLAGSYSDGVVVLYHSKTVTPTGVSLHIPGIEVATLNGNGTSMMTRVASPAAILWREMAGRPAPQTPLLSDVVDIAISSNGSRFATVGGKGSVQVWDAATHAAVGQPLKPQGGAERAWLNADGKWLVTVHTSQVEGIPSESTAQVWDVDAGRPFGMPVRQVRDQNEPEHLPIHWTSLSADGQRLLTTTGFGHAWIWDVKTGKSIKEIEYLTGNISITRGSQRTYELSGSISPDGKAVVLGRIDEAQVFNADSGATIGPALESKARMQITSFSADGKQMLTGTVEWAPIDPGRIVQVRDVATGKPIGAPMSHAAELKFADFSPDGTRVMTIAGDVVQVWDTGSGKQLGLPITFKGVHRAAISADGRKLVAVALNPAAIQTSDLLLGTATDSKLLAEVGEAVSGFAFNDFGSLIKADDQVDRFTKLRQRVVPLPDDKNGVLGFVRRLLWMQ